MTGWFPIRASRLHQRNLVCDDSVIRRATLFPFFDRAGAVTHVLVVAADSSDLRAFRLDTTRAWIPWRGPIRLDGPVLTLNEHVVDQLAPLWHFDPWWLLKDMRFESQAAVPILQLTNCVDAFDEQTSDLSFSGCLGSLLRVKFRIPSKEFNVRRFRPDMLPTREPTPVAARPRRSGWHLDPMW